MKVVAQSQVLRGRLINCGAFFWPILLRGDVFA